MASAVTRVREMEAHNATAARTNWRPGRRLGRLVSLSCRASGQPYAHATQGFGRLASITTATRQENPVKGVVLST